MNELRIAPQDHMDVVVVGGGPAGLAAATEIKRSGIDRVVVLERDRETGGVPRHCGHSPFGMREFGQVLSGRSYAARLTRRAERAGVEILTGRSVVSIGADGTLIVAEPEGLRRIAAARIVLATGARETTRAGRLVGGDRPLGVLNTGALQAHAHLEHLTPFRHPVIVGTELVSYSAILTARSIGAKPVAMIEERARPVARAIFGLLPRLLGIPVHLGATVVDIRGNPRVEAVTIRRDGGATEEIACDGVIFTGRFVPESSLARTSGLAIDPATGGPVIDASGRTSMGRVFAVGNLLRGIETAGCCWAEGRSIGRIVAADLAGSGPKSAGETIVVAGEGLRWVMPQRLAREGTGGFDRLQMRFCDEVVGSVVVEVDGRRLWAGAVRSGPERRFSLPLGRLGARGAAGRIVVRVEERG